MRGGPLLPRHPPPPRPSPLSPPQPPVGPRRREAAGPGLASPRGGAESGRRRRYLDRVGLAQVHVEGRAVGQDLAATGHRAQDVGPHLGQLCHRGPYQLPGGRQVPHGHGGRRRGPPQPTATPPGCCRRRRHVAVSCSALHFRGRAPTVSAPVEYSAAAWCGPAPPTSGGGGGGGSEPGKGEKE